MATRTITVHINGTDENPYERWGLDQNPFPQIGLAEYDYGEQRVNSLGGKPVTSHADIKKRLAGFAPEFVSLCCEKFQPGKMVVFQVSWED